MMVSVSIKITPNDLCFSFPQKFIGIRNVSHVSTLEAIYRFVMQRKNRIVYWKLWTSYRKEKNQIYCMGGNNIIFCTLIELVSLLAHIVTNSVFMCSCSYWKNLYSNSSSYYLQTADKTVPENLYISKSK